MDWNRVGDELIVGEWPDERGAAEIAEAGARDFLEVKQARDRPRSLGVGERWFRVHRPLVVDGWSAGVFRQFVHLMQTGEPGPVYVAARHPDDGRILAWVWEALRSRRAFPELRDVAAREGLRIPAGAWEFLAEQMSRDMPAAP